MKPTLASLFPNASQATSDRNPQLSLAKPKQNDSRGILTPRRRNVMNKTEAEYMMILEAQLRKGEILRYVFEGITLRWADMRYTPDFLVFKPKTIEVDLNTCQSATIEVAPQIILIEVKGGHIWDRDIVRFKGARAYWPEFAFEMWQKTKGEWKRKLATA